MAENKVESGNPYWWLGIIQGVLLIFIGWYLLTTPALTTLALVTLLGLYWLIAGSVDVILAIFNKTGEKSRGWELASGVIGIIAGLVIINNPVVSTVFTVTFLVYFVAFAFIFSGFTHIFLGKDHKWTWGGLILGIFYVILGLMLLGGPMIADAAALIWVLAFVAMIGGISAIIASFALKDSK